MKVDSHEGICPEFDRNVLYVCRDDHDDMPLVDLSMNLPPGQIQELPCLSLVLLPMEFIIRLIESACTSFIRTKLYLLLNKHEGISDMHVRLESIICEE